MEIGVGQVTMEDLVFYKNHVGDEAPIDRFGGDFQAYNHWTDIQRRIVIRLSTKDIRAVLDHYEIDLKKGLFTS